MSLLAKDIGIHSFALFFPIFISNTGPTSGPRLVMTHSPSWAYFTVVHKNCQWALFIIIIYHYKGSFRVP